MIKNIKEYFLIFFWVNLKVIIARINQDDCVHNFNFGGKCTCNQNSTQYVLICEENDYISRKNMPPLNTSIFFDRMLTLKVINKRYERLLSYSFVNISFNLIVLDYNNFESIDVNAFSEILRLNELNLNNNCIKDLRNLVFAFSGRENLERLHVENNLIEKLDFEFPFSFSSLKNLRLSGNMIKFIGKDVFKNMKNLFSLFLNNNNIRIIESEDCFINNFNMKTLHINNLELENETIILSITKMINMNFLTIKNSNLKEIPYFSALKSLVVERNYISHIKNASLSLSLNDINLIKNELTIIQDFYFKGLVLLEELELNENRISLIEPRSFADCIKLKILKLVRNNIKTLTNDIFIGLKVLRDLNLDENIIKKVDKNIYKNLPNIRRLSSRYNFIEIIPEHSFSELCLIQDIRLSYQRILSLMPHSFKNMKYLKNIALEGNDLNHIQNETFVNLSSLTTLTLFNNKIDKIDTNAFINLPMINRIDFRNNRLRFLENDFLFQFKNVKNLSISDNLLTFLKSKTFYGLISLLEINLSENKIYMIEKDVFWGLENSLKILKLQKNQLQLIKNFYFKNLMKLEELHLQQNQISSIDMNSFDDLINVKRLDLSENMIFSIDTIVFEKMKHLIKLDIENNNQIKKFKFNHSHLKSVENLSMFKVYNLTDFLFSNMSSLSTINIGFCSVEYMYRYTFFKLSSLKRLILENNKIKFLNKSLETLNSLEFLDLSENRMEFIQREDFINLKKLSNLKLNSNNLKFLEHFNIAEFFPNLKRLYLSNMPNGLISSLNFENLKKLEILDLSENHISTFSIFQLMKELRILNLRNIFVNLNVNYSFWRIVENLDYLREIQISGSNKISFSQTHNFVINNFVHLESLIVTKMNLQSVEELNINFWLISDLKVIDLSCNEIKTIKRAFFSKLNKLIYLNLSHNLIYDVESNSFFTPNILDTLDLSFNFISNLELNTFSAVSFNLTSNRLRFFDNSSIITTSSCMSSLKDNNLEEFPIFFIRNKLIMKFLDLSNNKINELRSLDSDDSNNERIIRINEFYLNKNNLRFLEDNSILSKLRYLYDLDLSENHLVDIGNSLEQMSRLKYLNLSHNKITYIKRNFLLFSQSLNILDLSYNRLKFIDNFTLDNYISLNLLYLNQNPNLILPNQTKTRGLNLLKNIYISSDFFYNDFTNLISTMSLFNLKRFKSLNLITFYHSINIDYLPKVNKYKDRDCFFIIYMIGNNRILNLKTSQDLELFLKYCRNYSLKKNL